MYARACRLVIPLHTSLRPTYQPRNLSLLLTGSQTPSLSLCGTYRFASRFAKQDEGSSTNFGGTVLEDVNGPPAIETEADGIPETQAEAFVALMSRKDTNQSAYGYW
jgi:hypothetical protein